MVYILLADGFEEIEALTPADILRRAGVSVALVGVTGELVTGSHGITVKTDLHGDMLGRALSENITEAVILPGGLPGADSLDTSPITDRFLTSALSSDAVISAICAAPKVLGRRGLLKGKKATCYPGFEKFLEGASVTDCQAIADGNIITGRSMGAALEFSLLLAKKLKGDDTGERIAAGIITK